MACTFKLALENNNQRVDLSGNLGRNKSKQLELSMNPPPLKIYDIHPFPLPIYERFADVFSTREKEEGAVEQKLFSSK